jgi:putative tricarboxylic transport membrane protein
MDTFISAFGLFFQLPVFLATFFGVGLGIVLGSIPGLTATMAIALIVPMTFSLSPIVSIGMLIGAYKGGCFGGSIPAILLNTPGTPAAAATSLDGHQMAKKSQGLPMFLNNISSRLSWPFVWWGPMGLTRACLMCG